MSQQKERNYKKNFRESLLVEIKVALESIKEFERLIKKMLAVETKDMKVHDYELACLYDYGLGNLHLHIAKVIIAKKSLTFIQKEIKAQTNAKWRLDRS